MLFYVLHVQSHDCVLPEDVKIFYLMHNGLQLHWTCLHQGLLPTSVVGISLILTVLRCVSFSKGNVVFVFMN